MIFSFHCIKRVTIRSLSFIPNRSFGDRIYNFIDSDGPSRSSFLLENVEFHRAVSQCLALRHVTLCHGGKTINQWHSLSFAKILSNLTSLELQGLQGNWVEMAKSLAKLLARCPNLKSLELKAAENDPRFPPPERTISVGYLMEHFLELICDCYVRRYKAPPLKLTRLRLGPGFFICEPILEKSWNYIDQLTDLSILRDLEFFNGFIKLPRQSHLTPIKIKYELLVKCRSLHRLCVTRLDEDLNSWLENGPEASIRELIILENYLIHYSILAKFNEPNITGLSSLLVQKIEHIWTWQARAEACKIQPGLWYQSRTLGTLLNHGRKLSKLSLRVDFSTQWVSTS